jgi:hypothetical protein
MHLWTSPTWCPASVKGRTVFRGYVDALVMFQGLVEGPTP